MKVYIDVVFFLNFMFDLLLLLSVCVELKKFPKIRRVVLGTLFGSSSIFFLFLPLTNFLLFLLKLGISIVMLLITFGYPSFQSFFRYIKTLYGNGIILGGMIYFLTLQFGYRKSGLIFFKNQTNTSFTLITLMGPILFYLYLKGKKTKEKEQALLHQVSFSYHGKEIIVEGYLDTGNTIKDPYKKRPVLILSHPDFTPSIEEAILVPFQTVGSKGLIRCVTISNLKIDQQEIPADNYLVGKSDVKVNLHGARCIIPEGMLKEDKI